MESVTPINKAIYSISLTQLISRVIATRYNTRVICTIMSFNYKWQSGNNMTVLGRIPEPKRERKY